MPNFFMTFVQKDPLRRDAYTIVDAPSMDDAINEMWRIYGHGWAFAYRSAEDAGVQRHGLSFIELGS